MSNNLERRLRRLESNTTVDLPWGRDIREWTDEQLLAVIGEPGPISDDRLAELAGSVVVIPGVGNEIMLGVSEASSAEAWVKAYAPKTMPEVGPASALPPRDLN